MPLLRQTHLKKECFMKKRITVGRLSLCYLVTYFLLFLLFYIPNYAFLTTDVTVDYIRHFLTELANFLLPVYAAVTVLNVAGGRLRPSLLCSLRLAATHAIYLLPYYYLYMLAYGFDSIEAISISLLITLLGVAANTLHILLFSYAILYTMRYRLIKDFRMGMPTERQKDKLTVDQSRRLSEMALSERTSKNPYDLGVTKNLGIFVAVMLQLMISLGFELYDTVSFLLSYAGSYRISEIIFITLSYTFILATMLITQYVAVRLSPLTEPDDE